MLRVGPHILPTAGQHKIQAALFDLDGTLMDSEPLTDLAIAEAMASRGFPGVLLPPEHTRGHTWQDIVGTLARGYPGLATAGLEAELAERWIAASEGIAPIPGSPDAVRAAAAHLRLAVVSSSPRAVIDAFLERLGVADLVAPSARIGSEDVVHGKPAPDAFLLAARRLGVAPDRCVVFEDASAGLTAARAAGMATVLVLHACAEPDRCRALADRAIADFRGLDAEHWQRLAERGLPGDGA
jgi:sugar-phosphatase